MIELNVGQKPLGSEVFQEGLLGDTFKLVDVDADKIREEWKNSETGIMDKVAAVNDSCPERRTSLERSTRPSRRTGLTPDPSLPEPGTPSSSFRCTLPRAAR